MKDTLKDRLDLDQLLHPAQAFEHPAQVVADPDLTLNEKRAILASWASDACAVEASPELRAGPKSPVRFDDIMDALKRLDGEAANKPSYGKLINRAQRWKDLFHKTRRGRTVMEPGTRRTLEAVKHVTEEMPQMPIVALSKSGNRGSGGVPAR